MPTAHRTERWPAGPDAGHGPGVAVAFVRPALQALSAAAQQRVLQAAGIAPGWLAQVGVRVPAPAFGALWLAVARELDDEFFGLDARRLKVGSFAYIAHAAAAQPRLGEALREMLRGFRLALDDIEAELTVHDDQAWVTLHNRMAPDSPARRRFAEETLLVMILGLGGALAGARWRPLALHWAGAPSAHAAEHRRMFTPHLSWHADCTRLVLPASLLVAPVRLKRAALKRFLAEAPASVFLKQVAAPGWTQRLRRQLRGCAGAWPSIDVLAAGLGTSPATLRRRLAEEGGTWQQLKDELRQELAQQRLAAGTEPVGTVALALGFEDVRSFQRAFRRWTGVSPGAWRDHATPTLSHRTDTAKAQHPTP
ncbi:MAG: AraC family transcriptional regulator ligand-binding domain-containing protein [Aquabacterium sp.]